MLLDRKPRQAPSKKKLSLKRLDLKRLDLKLRLKRLTNMCWKCCNEFVLFLVEHFCAELFETMEFENLKI